MMVLWMKLVFGSTNASGFRANSRSTLPVDNNLDAVVEVRCVKHLRCFALTKNAAMEWWTNLLNQEEYAEKRAKALERRVEAIGWAGALRLGADALGQKG
nr:zinc finger, RING/FYVE/PHD-type [Tanacetum cinerariifolium]